MPTDEQIEEISIAEDDIAQYKEIAETERRETMAELIRHTEHKAEMHVKEIWATKYGYKVGMTSTKDNAHVFEDIDWSVAHHKWNSDRVEDTDMWEFDLEALFYVTSVFFDKGIDVTIEDEIVKYYLKAKEDETLDI